MQRRKFIALSALGGAALGFTGVNCTHRNKGFYGILDKPQQLSYICDAKAIREIGMDYRLQTPTETDGNKLEALLTTDSRGKTVSSSSDNLYMQTLLDQKITHDFETGNTIVVRGWILAVTEARQCALLFVNSQ